MYRVVIIDDEPWTRGVIKNLTEWERLNLELVGEAADGESGLSLIRRLMPDIIITDVKMPRMSGIELAEKLRQENINSPILIVSGYDDFDYVRSALKLGVTDYLLKPIKPTELNQQLMKCKDICKSAESKTENSFKADFFARGWEQEYQSIYEKIITATKVGNRKILDIGFNELITVTENIYDESGSQDDMIGIYYSLLFALQEYINNAGYSKNDIFKSAETVYVFSKGNTPKEIITFLKDLFIKAVDSIARLRQSRNRLDIQAICRYINENYMTGISLEETADHFHVTKEYLSKAFRDETKTKFTDYVTTMRIRKAYDLLCNYDAPIKDVAEMVGYVDLAHFHKNFKRILGKTPGEVKESLKNDKETSN